MAAIGRRFHVERDGARLRQPLHRAALVAQFPVAVVDRRDRSGAHDPLQLVALVAGDFRHRVLQRHLNFGERRDRHPDRQVVVEHVVLAHIGMRQHIVAERLAVAQARAMAEHQPGMRASTAIWSVMVLALEGPTPILTTVMPPWPFFLR